jgi:lactam utilization protein B
VVSAGRAYLEDGKIIARGASSSLSVSSREQDSRIIQTYFDEQNVIQEEC